MARCTADGRRPSSRCSAHDVLLFVDGIIDIDSSTREGDRFSFNCSPLLTPNTSSWSFGQRRHEIGVEHDRPTAPPSSAVSLVRKDGLHHLRYPFGRLWAYNFRWMGSPNAQFERAASYFQGHFEGLGYDTHLMRVVDHLNPSQPESLNVVAWKRGVRDDCVQGMGAHMDIAPPAGPPGGGTWEGAYDNTAGTVAIMMYAQVLVDLQVECDTFLALWSSEEEGLQAQTRLPTTIVRRVCPKTRNCGSTSTWT